MLSSTCRRRLDIAPIEFDRHPVDLANAAFTVAAGTGPVGECHAEALPQAVFQAGVVPLGQGDDVMVHGL